MEFPFFIISIPFIIQVKFSSKLEKHGDFVIQDKICTLCWVDKTHFTVIDSKLFGDF